MNLMYEHMFGHRWECVHIHISPHSSTSVHIPQHPIPSTFIHFHPCPHSSTLVQVHPCSSTSIHVRPHPSTYAHLHMHIRRCNCHFFPSLLWKQQITCVVTVGSNEPTGHKRGHRSAKTHFPAPLISEDSGK